MIVRGESKVDLLTFLLVMATITEHKFSARAKEAKTIDQIFSENANGYKHVLHYSFFFILIILLLQA